MAVIKYSAALALADTVNMLMYSALSKYWVTETGNDAQSITWDRYPTHIELSEVGGDGTTIELHDETLEHIFAYFLNPQELQALRISANLMATISEIDLVSSQIKPV